MTEKQQLENLIDAWLLGQLSPEESIVLEQRIADDPEVAAMAAESRLAFEVIKAQHQKLLRQKLKDLDRDNLKHQSLLSLPAGIILLTLLFGLLSIAIHSCIQQPAVLATRYFVRDSAITYAYAADSADLWTKAVDQFESGGFEAAIHSFQQLYDEDSSTVRTIAHWNLLMAQLAKDGESEGWKTAMHQFLQGADTIYRIKATQLLKDLDSRWYKIFFSPESRPLESLKPRLI
jgi:hypothetical protein